MKGISIPEVFCEIISGLAVMLAAPVLLRVLGFQGVLERICSAEPTALTAAVVVVTAYLVGLLMDAIGMCLGEWFLDGLLGDEGLSQEVQAKFWRGVTPHVLQYRDTQWAYYSAYRNLLILGLIVGPLWIVSFAVDGRIREAVAVLVVAVVLEYSFWRTSKALLRIYNAIAAAFGT